MSPGPKWLEWMQRLISQNVEEQYNIIYSVEVVELVYLQFTQTFQLNIQ